jgi:hypothetical protein
MTESQRQPMEDACGDDCTLSFELAVSLLDAVFGEAIVAGSAREEPT